MNGKKMPISNREKHMKRAKTWLGCLRREEYPYSLYSQFLQDEVKEGRFMLDDIGTNEKELKELHVKGSAVAAKVWLGHIKKDPTHLHCAHFLTEEIKKSALTCSDIGTTMEELSQLAPMAAAIMINR